MTDTERLHEARRSLAGQDHHQAEALAREILKSRPRDAEALEVLAASAFQDARFDDARTFLKRCIALKPRHTEYRLRLSQIDVAEGRYGDALDKIAKAESINPRVTVTPAQKAAFLRLDGQAETARRLLDGPIRTGKADTAMAAEYARLEFDAGRYDEVVRIGERFDDPKAPVDARRVLHNILGGAHEKLGNYDQSFHHYTTANQPPPGIFDPDEYRQLVDRLLSTFTRQARASYPAIQKDDQVPVFVVGMPRSGTTLLDRIIDAHPKACGGGEMPDLTRIVRSLPRLIGSTHIWPECVAGLDQATADRVSSEYLKRCRRISKRAQRVVNKNLDSHLYIGLIQMLFPGARIIWMRREPIDNCLSCYAANLIPQNQPYAFDMTHLGVAYRQLERIMEAWKDAVDLPITEVHYETLIENQESESRRIIEFLDLEWDDRCLRFYDTDRKAMTLSRDQVSKPIYRTSVGRAANFGAHLDPLRRALGL